MKRVVKKLLSGVVPPSIRSAVRRSLVAEKNPDIIFNSDVRLEEKETGLLYTIDDCSFLAPKTCSNDLKHYTGTDERRIEFHKIHSLAKLGGTIFDIGAHAGLVSTLFCAANSQNLAISFEPSPILVSRLQEIKMLNGFEERMSIQQTAIGGSNHQMQMLIDPVGGFVQSQHFKQTMWGEPEAIQINVETIRSASQRLGLVPKFIKLDIEGYEYEAINGIAGFPSTP